MVKIIKAFNKKSYIKRHFAAKLAVKGLNFLLIYYG